LLPGADWPRTPLVYRRATRYYREQFTKRSKIHSFRSAAFSLEVFPMRLFVRIPRAALAVVMVLSAISFSLGSWTDNALAQGPSATYTYHQITNLTEGSGYLGFPVLSADGTTGVFSDAPGTGDPATPNRIYTIGFDGSGMREVDSYTSLCYCNSFVDISADGSTVISSESVQVRIADGGGARDLITLASNEITAISLSGDGETVFFLVRRSTAIAESGDSVPMGIWAIDASGGNLRHIVSPEAVAAAVGAPVDPDLCCFIVMDTHSIHHPTGAGSSSRPLPAAEKTCSRPMAVVES
jgi:hypothetical protein